MDLFFPVAAFFGALALFLDGVFAILKVVVSFESIEIVSIEDGEETEVRFNCLLQTGAKREGVNNLVDPRRAMEKTSTEFLRTG